MLVIFEQPSRLAGHLYSYGERETIMDVDDSLPRNGSRRSATNNVLPQCFAADGPAAYGVQDSGHFRAVIESLLARGFVVLKNHQPRGDGNGTGEGAPDAAVVGGPANDDNGDVSSVCGQLECLSAMEGVVYGLHVADKRDAARARSVTVLAAVGAHPNIVSYFSNWTDSRYRYVQLEYCPENLSSVSDRLECGADFRALLEHVACALDYLHRVKRYAHNRVNQWNIYRTDGDGNRAVYKLGGFLEATRLRQPVDDAAAFADVQSLCTTVLRLMRRHDNGFDDADDDVRELRFYLSSVIGCVDDSAEPSIDNVAANPAPDGRVNALSVWRWCCSSRQRQQQQREQLSYNWMAMVYGNSFFDGQMDLV